MQYVWVLVGFSRGWMMEEIIFTGMHDGIFLDCYPTGINPIAFSSWIGIDRR